MKFRIGATMRFAWNWLVTNPSVKRDIAHEVGRVCGEMIEQLLLQGVEMDLPIEVRFFKAENNYHQNASGIMIEMTAHDAPPMRPPTHTPSRDTGVFHYEKARSSRPEVLTIPHSAFPVRDERPQLAPPVTRAIEGSKRGR